jgi:eukaryotic-like serine/threonine-protein kinase
MPRRFQELDWIAMKALDKDRRRRYETANGLARDLERYLRDEPVEACPPSAWYRLRKLARRNRTLLITAALVCLVLVLGTAVSIWQALRATDAMNSERETLVHLEKANEVAKGQTLEALKALTQLGVEQKATRRELERTKEAEEKATRELFDALVAQARANRLSRRIGQRFGTFEILGKAITIAHQLKLPAERFLELRNEALAAMALTDLRVAKEWTDTPGGGLDFDLRHQRYARADLNGTVYVRHVGDGAEICRLPAPGPGENFPVFSPDGRLLAVMNPAWARVQVWRLSGKETSEVSETSEILPGKGPAKVLDQAWLAWGFGFSPDCLQVAFQHSELSADVFDLATEKSAQHLAVDGAVRSLAFNPKGRQLALVSEVIAKGIAQDTAQVRDLQTAKVLWTQPLSGTIPWLEWHPDGKTLAVGESLVPGGDVISLWDVAAKKLTGKLGGMQGVGIRFAFNHAGTSLASTGWGGISRLWDPLTGRQLFSTFASGSITPRFSPDDGFLAATEHGDNLCTWEIAAGDEYRTLTANHVAGNRRYFSSAISADGRLVAGGAEGGVGLWDLPSGKNLAFIEAPGINLALLEPAGALLTMARNGLFRRPFGREPATGLLHLGEPEKLPVPGVANRFAQSQDGRVLASAQFPGAVVLHADQPQRLIELGPHAVVRSVAVSPNGQWVATGCFRHPGGAKVWDNPFTFGESLVFPGRYFQGFIAAPSIWNYALSQTDVQSVMNNGLTGQETNLIASWAFDEGSGTTIHDQSPNGNNGELGNDILADEPAWVTI